MNRQFTQLAGFTFGKPDTNFEWSPTFRVQRSFGDGPSSTESRRSVAELPTEKSASGFPVLSATVRRAL